MDEINILIVEDELIIYMHITQTLKSLGFKNIHIARRSDEALTIASKIKIDILFSDIKIEGSVDGIDTAYTLQKLYDLPVIFITAFKDKEILRRVSEINTIGYLLKPYRPDELEALIEIAILKFNLLESDSQIKYKNYTFNKNSQKLKKDMKFIVLSKKEQYFVSLLFKNINSIIPYERIDTIVWYETYVTENTRRTFIYRFKNKFSDFDLKIEKNLGLGLFL